MEYSEVRIGDVLTTEYPDFLEYCAWADKKFISEITTTDYIAFRAQFGVSREMVSSIRQLIENYSPDEKLSASAKGNDYNVNRDTENITNKNDRINSDTIVTTKHEQHGEYIESLNNIDENSRNSFDEKITLTKAVDTQSGIEKENYTLAKIMDIKNTSNYDDVRLLSLNFNVRASNVLSKAKCHTMGDLLKYTINDLQILPGVGKKTVENILEVLSEYFKTQKEIGKEDKKGIAIQQFNFSQYFSEQVQNMLEGKAYTIDNLSSEEVSYFLKCVKTRDMLGAEICLLAKKGDAGLLYIFHSLHQYVEYNGNLNKIRRAFSLISLEVREQPVNPYWKAYEYSKLLSYDGESFYKKHIDHETNSILSDKNLKVESLPYLIMLKVHSETGLEACYKFIQWLSSDFEQMLHESILNCLNQKNEKGIEILNLRAHGETLEQIGASKELTRERIRQVEKKAIDYFLRQYYCNHCDIILILSAIHGGKLTLMREEMLEYLREEDTWVFWYLISRGELDCPAYYYDYDIDSIIIGSKEKRLKIDYCEKKLPDGIFVNELDEILQEISGGDDQIEKHLLLEVKNKYKLYGHYYHLGRLTALEVCDYILKNRFPNGYKIADEDYEKQFRYHMQNLFGNIEVLPSGHSIDSTISKVGMLYERGKYIHPSRLHIEKTTIDKINAYIANSPHTVLTYEEIFDAMSNDLNGTEITNKFILQGALNQYGCTFTTRRDYVTKEDSQNIDVEITHFVKDQGVVHKSTLKSEFSLSEVRIGQILARCPEVIAIDAGNYMHISELIIRNEELKAIRKYITRKCALAPISTRAMLDDFNIEFTDFIMENDIQHYGKLFGILQYLFKDEFHFSRPYISTKNDDDITTKSVLLSHMNGIDYIEIDDLVDLCQSVGIHFASSLTLVNILRPEYIRINETIIMRKDLVGLTEDVITQTAERIKEELDIHSYCVVNKITDFGWYPDINVEWNSYLVESIMESIENSFSSVRIPTTTTLPAIIFLGDEYTDDDYDSFIIHLLNKEHCLEPFTSKSQVLDWMIENGFCFKKLPSFLNDDAHLYTDENGLFRIE